MCNNAFQIHEVSLGPNAELISNDRFQLRVEEHREYSSRSSKRLDLMCSWCLIQVSVTRISLVANGYRIRHIIMDAAPLPYVRVKKTLSPNQCAQQVGLEALQ